MIDDKVLEKVRPFTFHGVEFVATTGNQVYGTCPFTGKKDKFYVNTQTLAWDSKTASVGGGLAKFLELIAKQNEADLTPARLEKLAANRKLPVAAFESLGIGWTGTAYSFPVMNADGKVQDIRTYKLGKRVISTPGIKTGLFGAEILKKAPPELPVYICEGEWDTAALRYVAGKSGKKVVVVGVPGANTFKAEWAMLFKRRNVFVCYDNDQPGQDGMKKVQSVLKPYAKTLSFIHWPVDLPDGFDVRDWVVKWGPTKKPKTAFRELHKLFGPEPGVAVKPAAKGKATEDDAGDAEPAVPVKSISYRALETTFRNWLHMKDTLPLVAVFGAVMANRLDGDPLWLFLVAPPGGMKSELLMSLALCEEVECKSGLTSTALVSGMNMGGQDPSLLPELNNRVLVIKDFTTILSMNPTQRDEVIGVLRDAYDGVFERQYGNGVLRKYESKFGVLAGVTPSIDAFTAQHSSLGERFLKLRMDDNIDHDDEEARIARAIGNIDAESNMRGELQAAALAFLSRRVSYKPSMPPDIKKRIVALALITAKMRGVVNRDRFNPELLNSKSSVEIGTRLGKQISKFAMGVSLYYGEKEVTEKAYRVATKVALASVSDRTEEVVRAFYRHHKESKGEPVRMKDILSGIRGLTTTTIVRTINDLVMLEILKKDATGTHPVYTLSGEMIRNIELSGVWKRKA